MGKLVWRSDPRWWAVEGITGETPKYLELQLQEKKVESGQQKRLPKRLKGYYTESQHKNTRLRIAQLVFSNEEHAFGSVPGLYTKNGLWRLSQPNIIRKIAFRNYARQLEELASETNTREPKLRAYINQLQDGTATLTREIERLNNAIQAIYQEREAAKKLKELNMQKRQRVIGRVSYSSKV